MAKIVHLTSKLPDIVNQVYERSRFIYFYSWFFKTELRSIRKNFWVNFREADAFREIEYNAAVKIQSWYRGLKIRAYIK